MACKGKSLLSSSALKSHEYEQKEWNRKTVLSMELCLLDQHVTLKLLPPSSGTSSFAHTEKQTKVHFLA